MNQIAKTINLSPPPFEALTIDYIRPAYPELIIFLAVAAISVAVLYLLWRRRKKKF